MDAKQEQKRELIPAFDFLILRYRLRFTFIRVNSRLSLFLLLFLFFSVAP